RFHPLGVGSRQISAHASALDGDPLQLRLSLLALGQNDIQHAVPEARIDRIFPDLATERNPALEAAIEMLGELPVSVLGCRALFASQHEEPFIEQHLDIVLLQTRYFGGDPDLVLVLGDLDAWPAAKPAESRQS